MEGGNIFEKILRKFSHFASLIIIVGYVVYWVELLFFKPSSHTSYFAAFFSLILLIFIFFRKDKYGVHGNNQEEKGFPKLIIYAGILLSAVVLLIGLYQSLLPPHLIQETDAFNYHITIPRQLLLQGSFAHIPWSVGDLYFLPVDFALAPYWLCTTLPNKIPQFVILLGLILVSCNLAKKIGSKSNLTSMLIVFAILGSQNVAIQSGTAMIDLVLCYLMIAALDSLLEGKVLQSALEFCFYFWSKSFMPVQNILILGILFLVILVLKKFNFKKINWSVDCPLPNEISLKKFFAWFVIFSIFVGGPFIYKSVKYAKTPLFPFFVGSLSSGESDSDDNKRTEALAKKAEQILKVKDDYDSDRSISAFLKHLWIVAVPEKDVNNRYDYPIGLVYLLCLGPFIAIILKGFKEKKVLLLPLFVVASWYVWWLGSHQSRYLYVPVILMIIIILSQKEFHRTILSVGLAVALALNALSLYRAYKNDFGKPALEILRDKDKQLLLLARDVKPGGAVELDFHDVAFAEFKVRATNYNSVFVLETP